MGIIIPCIMRTKTWACIAHGKNTVKVDRFGLTGPPWEHSPPRKRTLGSFFMDGFEKKNTQRPIRHGLVGWALSCKAKGRRLDSRSEHLPGLRTWSLGGAFKRQLIDVSLSDGCFSPSLSPSLPLSLESIKEKKLNYGYEMLSFSLLIQIF